MKKTKFIYTIIICFCLFLIILICYFISKIKQNQKNKSISSSINIISSETYKKAVKELPSNLNPIKKTNNKNKQIEIIDLLRTPFLNIKPILKDSNDSKQNLKDCRQGYFEGVIKKMSFATSSNDFKTIDIREQGIDFFEESK
ncbi:hypothetical protein ['Prunus avium' virescence phytoplasma]